MKVVDQIEWAFSKRDKNKADSIVVFYNDDYDRLTLSGEIQMAEKWSEIVNDKIPAVAKLNN